MVRSRWMTGIGVVVLCAAGAIVAPSLQAQSRADRGIMARQGSLLRSDIGSFTPASADPKLAAIMARTGLDDSSFRFTPTESRSAGRAVTVAVRSRPVTGRQSNRLAAVSPSLNLAPIAYNLGSSVGWKRFAVTADLAKVDIPTQVVARQRINHDSVYNVPSAKPSRLSATASRETANPILNLADDRDTINLGGSYSVTRNIAVTAGLRYKNEDQRLPRLTTPDSRRDNQAVYVGTAFRF